MHELPKDLTNSLRSFRGSTYRRSTQEPPDVEKGADIDTTGDEDGSEISHNAQRSLVLHPSASNQAFSRNVAHHDSTSRVQRHPDAPGAKSVFTAPKVSDPDPAADRLDDNLQPLDPAYFYELMGMRHPNGPGNIPPKKLAVEHGLYARIHSDLEYVQAKYRIYDVIVYVFLVLQVLLSAVFIVLGGLRVESHVAIAVLGAISTVIAGSLALMKGQGLPNRLRQLRDNLRNVVFECEELYADVGAKRPVRFEDVKKIREDYLRVTEEARRNHPDTFNPSTVGLGPNTNTAKPGRRTF